MKKPTIDWDLDTNWRAYGLGVSVLFGKRYVLADAMIGPWTLSVKWWRW